MANKRHDDPTPCLAWSFGSGTIFHSGWHERKQRRAPAHWNYLGSVLDRLSLPSMEQAGMTKKWSQRDWAGLGWAGGFFVCTLLMVLSYSQILSKFQGESLGSREGEAVVTSAMRGWQSRDDGEPPFVSYRFEVDGRSYVGTGGVYTPEGQLVRIRYSPSNPSNSWVVGDEPDWSSFAILPILGLFATGACFMLSFNQKTFRMVNSDRSTHYSVTPIMRFPVVVISLVSAYLAFVEGFRVRIDLSKVVAWASVCFLFYPVIRWRAWIALVPLIPLVVLLNPIFPIHLTGDLNWWVSGIAGISFAIIAVRLKPSQEGE